MKRAMLVIAVALGGFALGSCGESDSTADSSPQIPVQSSEDARQRSKPVVGVPPTPPPKKVIVEDLVEGTGKEAEKGDVVTLLYVGTTWDGEAYSDSWEYYEPPQFVLGGGALAPGFDHGIRGMKAGGRREVLVPYTRIRTAETSTGNPVPLQPADTLVLVVDLLDVD